MIRNGKILVSEIFQSISGEGFNQGRPTVFFRTVGCNLRCSWCDSTYTFEEKVTKENGNKWYSLEEAVEAVESYGIYHITITGGEPLMEENKGWMKRFISRMIANSRIVEIETNGAINLKDYRDYFGYTDRMIFTMDWKCTSSGMKDKMLKDNLILLGENDMLKAVVSDEDFDDLEEIVGSTLATLCISPVFNQVTMERIPEFVLKHKNSSIKCQLQIHKFFWPAEKRGV